MVQSSPTAEAGTHEEKRDDGILESYKSLSDGFDALMNRFLRAAHPW